MSIPKISVVIPALNEEAEMGECLESLSRQGFRDFEVIVVDNGSSDATPGIAQGYSCRVLYEHRRGASCARQLGFASAQAEIIASTDADTVVSPDWLELIYRSFQEDPKLVGVHGRVLLKEGSSPSRYFNQLIPLTDPLLTSFLEVSHSLSLPHFCGANFAVRRKIFEQVGGFRSRDGCFYRVSEDVQLGLKLRKVGEVRFLKNLIVYTSARKLDSGSWKVPLSNAKNYVSMALLRREI
ncbi:MAG: glycosyltransferase family 2 protein [Candidatus Bipolaricaulia bacterium]